MFIILILRFNFIVMLWLNWVWLVICYSFSLWENLSLRRNLHLTVFGKTHFTLASWEMQTLFVFKFYWIISQFRFFNFLFLNFYLSCILLINNLIFMFAIISHAFSKNFFTKSWTFYLWLSYWLNKILNRSNFWFKDKSRLWLFYVIIWVHFVFEFKGSILRSLIENLFCKIMIMIW